MRWIFVFALALALCAGVRAEVDAAVRAQRAREFETCDYQRADAAACALRYGDTNGDGLVSPAEIDAMKARYLSVVMRAGAWIAAAVGQSTAVMMRKCDFDGDGYLSRSDFDLSADTCLADCRRVTLLFKYVCSKAIAEERARAHAALKHD